jgi:TIR domain
MANVFISHRSVDAALAEKLAIEIRSAGHVVWLDAWEIRIGDEVAEKMNEGLEGATYVIVCYSSSGLAPWMAKEVWASVARQLNGLGVKTLPVRLSGGSPPALLSGTKYADLVLDWKLGVTELLRAIR